MDVFGEYLKEFAVVNCVKELCEVEIYYGFTKLFDIANGYVLLNPNLQSMVAWG